MKDTLYLSDVDCQKMTVHFFQSHFKFVITQGKEWPRVFCFEKFSLFAHSAKQVSHYLRNKKKKIPLMTGEEVDINLDAME